MKHFRNKILLFVAPIIILVVVLNLAFPVNAWTFRNWEALGITNLPAAIGPFYRNQDVSMIEQGELVPNTANAVKRFGRWQTDEMGYRNDNNSFDSSEIVYVGDSFVAGPSLDQNETLSSVTQEMTHHKTNQVSTGNFNDFRQLFEMGLIGKPKTVILTICERMIPAMQATAAGKTKPSLHTLYKPFKKWLNQSNYVSATLMYTDRIFKNAAFRSFKSKIAGAKRIGVQSPVNPSMFYYAGSSANIFWKDAEMKNYVNIVLSYKHYCDENNIRFVFLPGPNKETIYYEWVPFQNQPPFLNLFNLELAKKGVTTVNTVELFNTYRTGRLLYCLDDGHWNGAAIKLAVTKLINELPDLKK